MPWRTTGHELGTSRFNREITVLLNKPAQLLAQVSDKNFQRFDSMLEIECHEWAMLVHDDEVG